MKLYTRTGDGGQTSLGDGSRVSKSNPQVSCCGDLDELNALLGWCRAGGLPSDLDAAVHEIQSDLFSLGAELAMPVGAARRVQLAAGRVAALESLIDLACAEVPALRNFILPGGSEAASRVHLARACCRRAERAVVVLVQERPDLANAITYLNRLSDLLFAWARLCNARTGVSDVPWRPDRTP